VSGKIIAVIVGVWLLSGYAVYAGVDPANLCKEAKAKAAGKKASDLLKAFGKNQKKQDVGKLSSDISKAQSKFTKGFTKAEGKGGCLTSGDSDAIEAKVDTFVADVVGWLLGGLVEKVFVTPTATDVTNVVVSNPGKGWLLFGCGSGPHPNLSVDVLALGTTGYSRFNWKDIQPEESTFNWLPIDSAIASWKAVGRKFAFRVMAANTHAGTGEAGKYVTPKWVFDQGANATTYVIDPQDPYGGLPGPKVIPVWDDPIFIQKVKNLVAALAARYDGHADVDFIDIGTYGNWGEQHNWPYGGPDLTSQQLIEHMTWYKNEFSQTQLLTVWGIAANNPAYDWAVNNTIGMRRDGILGASPKGEECTRALYKEPAVFEWHRSYQDMVSGGYWSQERFWTALFNGRPSYQGTYWCLDANLMYAAEGALMRQAANLLGYHFVLESAEFPKTRGNGQTDTFVSKWRNDGLAPAYLDLKVHLSLLDAQGNVLQTIVLDLEPYQWAPYVDTNSSYEETTSFAFQYHEDAAQLAIGLFSSQNLDEPDVALGIEGRLDSGWYVLEP